MGALTGLSEPMLSAHRVLFGQHTAPSLMEPAKSLLAGGPAALRRDRSYLGKMTEQTISASVGADIVPNGRVDFEE